MTPGDLVWVEFPAGAGRAQAGRRPALVIQTDDATRKLPTILVIPLTSQQSALRFPGTTLIQPDPATGLKQPSVALVFQLTTIDQRYVTGRLGAVDAKTLEEVWTAFDEITARTPR